MYKPQRAGETEERGNLPSLLSFVAKRHLGQYNATLAERGSIAQRYAAELRDTSEHEWSMDEIEAEINAARCERKARDR